MSGCWLFHSWGKWQQAKANYLIGGWSLVQVRDCEVCGKRQIERV